MDQDQNISIVMVPFPAQGHLNQLLHLSLILSSQNLTVHYATPSIHINQVKTRLQGWPASALDSLHFHDLPIPPFLSPPPNPDSSVPFPSHLQPLFEAFEQVRPHLASLLQSLSKSSRRVVVIHDRLVSFAGIEASALSNGESYCFRCVPPSFDLAWSGEDGPASEILKSQGLNVPSLDGCVTEEFLELVSRHDDSDQVKNSGMLMNTSHLIEGEFIDLFMQQPDSVGKKLFFIGPLNPLNPTVETTETKHECLKWLDNQPTSSVLYISFGSCSELPNHQIEQLAMSLLNSDHRFIWVLREADRGNIFTAQNELNLQSKLPLGFMENIEGKGYIIKDWAPQLDILSHESIAAFMSHCGWNSCMESISMGKPILAWPMHSDQPWNAVLVSEYMKVGLIVRDWARRKEIVKAEEIEGKIRMMMSCDEGKEIRRRASELGETVRKGGGSKAELLSFVDHITR